jgi:phosphoribosylaminoimidazole carboxylase PurE protein
MEKAAINLFKRGTKIAARNGLILVDTKYEFGDYYGELTLIDEVHTPDSSRYWLKATYKKRIAEGKEPENFDKEFFRIWYAKKGYRGDGIPPTMPASYRLQVSRRYLKLFEMLTGGKLTIHRGDIKQRILKNLKPLKTQVLIIAGSHHDDPFVETIQQHLNSAGLSHAYKVASAHKQPRRVLDIIERYQSVGSKPVIITVAGRSNALSGFVAANSPFPVIACPPFKDQTDYLINIHSTLQMPSNVPVMTVIDPGNAVLAVKRILS